MPLRKISVHPRPEHPATSVPVTAELQQRFDAIRDELHVPEEFPQPVLAEADAAAEGPELPDRDDASADDVDLVADGEVVPDRHGVGRAYADAP